MCPVPYLRDRYESLFVFIYDDSASVQDREQARQAAMQALGAAAEQMAHIAPEDPLAAAVLRGLNQRNRSVTGSDAPSRSVIWY